RVAGLQRLKHVDSDLLALRFGKEALWTEDQDREQDDVRGHLLEASRQVIARKLFDDADDDPTNQGAGYAAETAEDGCRERLEAEKAHVDVKYGARRQQDACDARGSGADAPDQ